MYVCICICNYIYISWIYHCIPTHIIHSECKLLQRLKNVVELKSSLQRMLSPQLNLKCQRIKEWTVRIEFLQTKWNYLEPKRYNQMCWTQHYNTLAFSMVVDINKYQQDKIPCFMTQEVFAFSSAASCWYHAGRWAHVWCKGEVTSWKKFVPAW